MLIRAISQQTLHNGFLAAAAANDQQLHLSIIGKERLLQGIIGPVVRHQPRFAPAMNKDFGDKRQRLGAGEPVLNGVPLARDQRVIHRISVGERYFLSRSSIFKLVPFSPFLSDLLEMAAHTDTKRDSSSPVNSKRAQ